MAKKADIELNTGFETKAQAEEYGYTAVCIERISDGAMLNLNKDLKTYSFSHELVPNAKNYTFERLMEDHRAKGQFRVTTWVKNLNIEKYSKFF